MDFNLNFRCDPLEPELPVEVARPEVPDLGGRAGHLGHGHPLALAQVQQVDGEPGDLGAAVVLGALPGQLAVLGPHLGGKVGEVGGGVEVVGGGRRRWEE